MMGKVEDSFVTHRLCSFLRMAPVEEFVLIHIVYSLHILLLCILPCSVTPILNILS